MVEHTGLSKTVKFEPLNGGAIENWVPAVTETTLDIRVRMFTFEVNVREHHLYAELLEDGAERMTQGGTLNPVEQVLPDSGESSDRGTSETVGQPGRPVRTVAELSGDGERVDLNVWTVSQSGHGSHNIKKYGKVAAESSPSL